VVPGYGLGASKPLLITRTLFAEILARLPDQHVPPIYGFARSSCVALAAAAPSRADAVPSVRIRSWIWRVSS
jgi:hypothetical protein